MVMVSFRSFSLQVYMLTYNLRTIYPLDQISFVWSYFFTFLWILPFFFFFFSLHLSLSFFWFIFFIKQSQGTSSPSQLLSTVQSLSLSRLCENLHRLSSSAMFLHPYSPSFTFDLWTFSGERCHLLFSITISPCHHPSVAI